MSTTFSKAGGLAVLGLAFLLTACEDYPPVESTQVGYRGTGMVEIDNPRRQLAMLGMNEVPEAQPPVEPGGPAATEVYQNVQVLTDVSADEFMRLMVAMTEWVSPDEGCAYCHNEEDLADDSPYAKQVSRRMIEMTRAVNADWDNHVAETGVTCFTCHRGQPVPDNIWFHGGPEKETRGMAASRQGQNLATAVTAYSSLPYDPFRTFLENSGEVDAQAIRVVSDTALDSGLGATIKQTEATYGLMMQMSDALGVNCTYCHNSRSFYDWEQSSPTRVTAFHGIRMVRDLNQDYLGSLQGVFPPERLGPHGDVPKLSCATCHQGQGKPLNGAPMLADYPALAGPGGD